MADAEWLASLDAETRAKADEMSAALTELGAPTPIQWVRSEISENFPQFTTFLLLRGIWAEIIDDYRRDTGWIESSIEEAQNKPASAFSDAGLALKRMRNAGISDGEIASLARKIAYVTAFRLLYHINYGTDSSLPQQWEDKLPGWALMECTPEGELTGRTIDSVYESLLSLDPSGREGKPE